MCRFKAEKRKRGKKKKMLLWPFCVSYVPRIASVEPPRVSLFKANFLSFFSLSFAFPLQQTRKKKKKKFFNVIFGLFGSFVTYPVSFFSLKMVYLTLFSIYFLLKPMSNPNQ